MEHRHREDKTAGAIQAPQGPGLNPKGSSAASPEKEATLGKEQVHTAEFTRHMLPSMWSFPKSIHRRAPTEAYQMRTA